LISIRFNYELGKLSAVDKTSEQLLPAGYALLDLCALFLSGFVAVKSKSLFRKLVAWFWFGFLLCLSLWAAASFTLSVDHRLANTDLSHAIEQKRSEVDGLNNEVETWRENVKNAVNFKTKHQKTLDGVQARQKLASDELHALEKSLTPPTMAIYEKVAPHVPFDADTLSLFMRLLWAGAMTLSPLVIVLLVVAELDGIGTPAPLPRKKEPLNDSKNAEKPSLWSSWRNKAKDWANRQKLRRAIAKLEKNAMQQPLATPHNVGNEQTQDYAVMTENRSLQPTPYAPHGSNVVPINGHNQHTETLSLNGLKYAVEWLAKQPQGRVTRSKLSHASKVRAREGVTRIIDALLDRGLLVRVGNGQLYKAQAGNRSFN